MQDLVKHCEELRNIILGPGSAVAEVCRDRLLSCLDRLYSPPVGGREQEASHSDGSPLFSSGSSHCWPPAAFLQLCWTLRGKLSARELLCLSEDTMTRLASRVFPLSVKDQETVRAHWKRLKSDKEREMQQAEENRQRKLEAAAATEAARRAVSATPVSKRTRIDPFSNPVPWRRK